MYAPVTPPLSVKLTVLTSFTTVVAFVGNELPDSSVPVFAGVFCITPGLLPALAHPTSRKSSTIPVAPSQWHHRLCMIVLPLHTHPATIVCSCVRIASPSCRVVPPHFCAVFCAIMAL